jgi:hypothetical protein
LTGRFLSLRERDLVAVACLADTAKRYFVERDLTAMWINRLQWSQLDYVVLAAGQMARVENSRRHERHDHRRAHAARRRSCPSRKQGDNRAQILIGVCHEGIWISAESPSSRQSRCMSPLSWPRSIHSNVESRYCEPIASEKSHSRHCSSGGWSAAIVK